MISKSTGSATRISGDHPLAFNMKRYSNGDDAIWVWWVSEYCNQKPLIKIADVQLADLRKMRAIIDEHIGILETDGGHKVASAA